MQEGSSHLHYDQCSAISDMLVERVHEIHLQPYYKKYLFCFRVDCFG